MKDKLVPLFCLWCVQVRIERNECQRCGTRYGRAAARAEKPRGPGVHLGEKETARLRALRFRWEI